MPFLLGAALAQSVDPEVTGTATRQELETRRVALERAREAEIRIRAEIATLSTERAKLAAELVRTAERSRSIEEKMSATEERLAGLGAAEADLRATLASRRSLIAELLAGLQRLGRQPPPAFLVRPQDALASVRSAILLGAVLPEMRAEAEALAVDLAELDRLRREVSAEHDGLARDRAELEAARMRLALLVEARQNRQGERERALGEERRRAETLGREVTSLEELIVRMEREVEASRKAAAAAEASSAARARQPKPPPPRAESVATLANAGRLAPAIPFATAKGLLPIPVSGTKLRRFGESDGFGGAQKGISLSTRPSAQVTAPCDGWVVYAGPFRSYGQLLILNAGDGYHVLLAGMEKISVELGQFVLTGEPVAAMGGQSSRVASAVNAGLSQPVLYVEFRKDGVSIDPGPWWAGNSAEKVRG